MVGDLVSLTASVNYVGATSMVIGIEVVADNVIEGAVKHINARYATMVAQDADGKPQKAPPVTGCKCFNILPVSNPSTIQTQGSFQPCKSTWR